MQGYRLDTLEKRIETVDHGLEKIEREVNELKDSVVDMKLEFQKEMSGLKAFITAISMVGAFVLAFGPTLLRMAVGL